MTDYDFLILIIRGVTMLLIAVGLFYTGYQIKLSRDMHRDNHDWFRRIESQKALQVNNLTQHPISLNRFLNYMNTNEAIPLDVLKKLFKENPEIQSSIHKLLNEHEGFARGIFQGVYDEEIIKLARRTSMIKIFDVFKSYIDHRRKEFSPNTWGDYESLIIQWRVNETKVEKRGKTGIKNKIKNRIRSKK